MSDETIFTVHIETDVELSVGDIWPDGDAPKNPTAEDVAEAMEHSGGVLTHRSVKRRVLDDWCLLDDLEVTVSGIGLEGELTSVKVWD